MKISAINSNYETKLLKKNQKNNINTTTPSFEGMNKLNKVSAKKLALALMAGIAVTTPSVYAAPTKAVTESTIKNTGKNNFYINPKVAEKYPEINPAEHKNFDLYEPDLIGNEWINEKRENIFDVDSKFMRFVNSLDAQLLNYYIENPQEKNLPNDTKIYSFIDYYNKNNKYPSFNVTFEQTQKMLNLYKEISQKYNVTEQEAVWNCPSFDREMYQHRIYDSETAYYEKNNYFMNPVPENREKIKDFIISYDGTKSDDFQKRVVDNINKFSPKVIDEIHTREINTLIHGKMQYSSSKGSDYSKYIEESPVSNIKSKATSTVTPATNKSYTTNTATSSTTAQRRAELDIKQANLEINIGNIKLEIQKDKNSIIDNNNKIFSNNRQISNLEYLNTLKQRDIQSYSRNYELATSSYKTYWKNQIARKQYEINENLSMIRDFEVENSRLNNNSKILESAINTNNIELQQAENELRKVEQELNELQ